MEVKFGLCYPGILESQKFKKLGFYCLNTYKTQNVNYTDFTACVNLKYSNGFLYYYITYKLVSCVSFKTCIESQSK